MIDARVSFLELVGYDLHPDIQDVQRLHREGWSVADLAEAMHVDARSIYRYLRLRTPCPGPRCLTMVRGGGLCSFCRASFIRRGAQGDPRDLSEAGVDGANLSHLLPGVQR